MADRQSTDFVQDASLVAVLESARELAEQSPEAFGRLVVEILCKLASLDHEAYEFFLSRVISRELRAAGLSVVRLV